jgi:hypothetical protein
MARRVASSDHGIVYRMPVSQAIAAVVTALALTVTRRGSQRGNGCGMTVVIA